MKAELQSTIDRLSSASESIYFNWDASTKTWCLSGITNGLGWVMGDYEANDLSEAEHDANEYLLAGEEENHAPPRG